MSELRVIGVDPSTDGVAWAYLRMSADRRFEYVAKANEPLATVLARLDVFRVKFPVGSLVAVETPPADLHIPMPPPRTPEDFSRAIGMYRAKGASLIATSGVAWAVLAHARAIGLRAVSLTPNTWRAALGVASRRKGVSQDDLVEAAVRRIVPTWPSRSNVDTRDAAGVALAAALNQNATRGTW